MTYGTAAQVAAKARLWTDNGVWVDPVEDYDIKGTNPTLSTVTEWLEGISAQMDIALGTAWFVAPVDSDDDPGPYKAISEYVVSLVADQCHLANGIEREVSPQGKIMSDITKWVTSNADGFLQAGLPQRESPSIKTQATFRTIG
jgi:hypothetical protein